jgi:hypothetical protein
MRVLTMDDKAALLREVEIALEAVRAGIEAIAKRPEMATVPAITCTRKRNF